MILKLIILFDMSIIIISFDRTTNEIILLMKTLIKFNRYNINNKIIITSYSIISNIPHISSKDRLINNNSILHNINIINTLHK